MKTILYNPGERGSFDLDGSPIRGIVNCAGKTYVMTEKATYVMKPKSRLRMWFERWMKKEK